MRIKKSPYSQFKKPEQCYKIFLSIKERLQDKDLQNWEEGTTQKARTTTNKQ